jgi:hypothetical protein
MKAAPLRRMPTMPIDQEREEEIIQCAENSVIDDVDSLYPLAEERESVLLERGQHIAHEYGFLGEEATFFASSYASFYMAEIDCIDRDYEPQDNEERGFIRARRIRLAALDPLASFRLCTPDSERDYETYRLARCAYNASRRMHESAQLLAVHFIDVDRKNLREEFILLACGSLKQTHR